MTAGLLVSARSLLAGLAALGRTRLELFGVELQEEIARLTAALAGAVLLLMLAALSASFGAAALVIAVDPDHRVAAALGVAAVFLLCAAVTAAALRHVARSKPRPFDETIAQIERDYKALRQ